MTTHAADWKRRLRFLPRMRAAGAGSHTALDWLGFWKDFARFSTMAAAARRPLPRWEDRFPCLGQKKAETIFDRHYVYHTAWAARMLAELKPTRHVDISSSLDFVAIASAFVPIEHYDYRPPDLHLDGVKIGFANLLALPFPDRSIESISCMHVVEHVGLGRYGDPLGPEGDRRAMRELSRVLATGGQLLFVVPVGRPRICFNAHRVYGYHQVLDNFFDLELSEFRLLTDRASDGGLTEASPEIVAQQEYGCGCFRFLKPV